MEYVGSLGILWRGSRCWDVRCVQFGIAGLMGVMPVLNRRAKRTVLSTHYYGGKKVEKSHRCADFSIPSLCRSHKLGIVEPNLKFGSQPSQKTASAWRKL